MKGKNYEKSIYNIKGMKCAGCSSTIEENVRKLKEVKEANVNLPLARLEVQCDTNFDSQIIIDTVKEAGFEASENLDEEDHRKEINSEYLPKLKMILLLSTILMYVGMSSHMNLPLFFLDFKS